MTEKKPETIEEWELRTGKRARRVTWEEIRALREEPKPKTKKHIVFAKPKEMK
jgi:hypothetical protein